MSSASYEYDINGQRTKKTFNTVAGSVTTEYYYNNGMFLGFYRSDGFDVRPLMDPSGSMYGITVYETNQTAPRSYNFVYNAQGDVIGLYSYITGSVVATYDYDAWGNCTVKALIADDNGHTVSDANHIANLNPFRYRGYYYDTETGLYYLGSRYYDPVVGRFINADMIMGVNQDMASYNLFAYCGNNPVNRADNGGKAWFAIAGAIVGGILGGVSQVVTNIATGNEDIFDGVLGATVGGATAGAIATTGNIALACYVGAAAESAVNEVVDYATGKKELTVQNVVDSATNVIADTVVNGTLDYAMGEIAGTVIKTNKGWFKPRKFVSSFFGKYAQKTWAQGAIGSGLTYLFDAALSTAQEKAKNEQERRAYEAALQATYNIVCAIPF